MTEETPTAPSQSKWLPAVTAAALIGAVVVAGVAGGLGGDDGGAGPRPPASSTSPPRQPTGKPVATVAVTTIPEARKTKLSAPLTLGSAGDEVKAVQQRLKDLHLDPGPIDGQFGELTRTAVWGFEKLILGTASDQPTGTVTPAMWKRMQDDISIEPRRPEAASTNHTEVYLPEQMVIFFRKDEPVLVSHMSSGNNEEFCEEVTISPGEYGNEDGKKPLVRGECGRSFTPPGVFTYHREVEGTRKSGLGDMWNPIYFNYGVAIHGALNVPLEPASHGCIRIPLPVSEYIQDLMELGDQVYVFDGVQEPEAVSERDRLPVFNWKDPDWVPPTTIPPPTTPPSTPPTTPPTTEPPTTPPSTVPPTDPPTTTTTSTTQPPTTTTTPPPPTTTTRPPPATSAPGPPGTDGRGRTVTG